MAPTINTRIFTLEGCCTPTTSGNETAWSVACNWLSCNSAASDSFVRDCLCGMFCIPCQLGVLKSESGGPSIPGDVGGWCVCVSFSCFGYACPIAAVCIEGLITDEHNNGPNGGTGFCSALTWAMCGLCTCAHCVIAKAARESKPSSTNFDNGALL